MGINSLLNSLKRTKKWATSKVEAVYDANEDQLLNIAKKIPILLLKEPIFSILSSCKCFICALWIKNGAE